MHPNCLLFFSSHYVRLEVFFLVRNDGYFILSNLYYQKKEFVVILVRFMNWTQFSLEDSLLYMMNNRAYQILQLKRNNLYFTLLNYTHDAKQINLQDSQKNRPFKIKCSSIFQLKDQMKKHLLHSKIMNLSLFLLVSDMQELKLLLTNHQYFISFELLQIYQKIYFYFFLLSYY